MLFRSNRKMRASRAALLAVCLTGAASAGGDTVVIKRLSALGIDRLLGNRPFGTSPDLRVFDLNMDGLDDIITRASDGTVYMVVSVSQSSNEAFFDLTTITLPISLGAMFQGDFDRDGFKELYARAAAGGVAVINDAAGPAPGAPVTIISVNAIDSTFSMAACDFDSDGDHDLAITPTASSGSPGATCHMYRNDTPIGEDTDAEDWVQTDTCSLSAQAFPQEFSSVSAGRINGDAHADLLLVSSQRGQCVIMGGNGDDTFEPINPATGALVPGGDPSANAIDMGASPFIGLIEDLDGDGSNDLMVLGGGSLNVRFGNGNGTFSTLVQTPAPGSNYPIVGDIDSNGTKDIVTLVEVFGAVSQWDSLGVTKLNPDRTFQATVLTPTIYRPRSGGFLRLNEDDPPALLVSGEGQVALHRNVSGELKSFQRIQENTGGGGVRELVVGDLTGDGYNDAWFSTFGFGNRVLVNPGDGSGTLGPTQIPGQGTSNAAPAALVDRPAIGRGAIGFSTNATDFFNLMAVNAPGTQLEYINFVTMPADARDVARLDFSGDGTVGLHDFVLLHDTGNPGISVLSQATDGTFPGPFTSIDLSASSPPEGWWSKFDAFDDSFSKGVMVTGPGGAGMYRAAGATFDFFPAFGAAFAGGVSVAAGDLNGDGRADVVVGRDLGAGTGAVTIALQTGTEPPTFASPTTVNITGVPASLDIADLDADDDADIVVVSNNGAATMQRTIVLRNDGTGSFPAQDLTEHPVGQSPARVILADLHNPVATRGGLAATAGPEIIQGGRGPNAFFGLQVYENLASFSPPPCPGDADGNNAVNFADITGVLTFFGADYSPGTGEGDADHNGPVNFADITAVLTNFGLPCP